MLKHLKTRAHPVADPATVFVTHAHRDVSLEMLRTYVEIGEGGYWTIHALAWSPDGRLWASAGADNTLRIWNAATNRQRQTISCTVRGGKVLDVVWSPDCRYLGLLFDGTAGPHESAREVHVLKVETGEKVYHGADYVGCELIWSEHEPLDAISRDSFAVVPYDPARTCSHDGRFFATGGDERRAHIIGQATTATTAAPDEPTGEWSRVGACNGHRVTGGTVRIVDRANQHVKMSLPRGTSLVAWSPVDDWVASVHQTTISVWDVDVGALRCEYRGHSGWWPHVTCLSWAPSGRQIASGDSSGAIHIWRVDEPHDS